MLLLIRPTKPLKSPNAPITSGALQFQFPPVSLVNRSAVSGTLPQQMNMNPATTTMIQQQPKGIYLRIMCRYELLTFLN